MGREMTAERQFSTPELQRAWEAQAPHDQYSWWRRALAGETVGGPSLPVHDSSPECGFWRKRISRGGPFVPVAVWQHEGKFVALIDGKHEADPNELWTYICRHPITEEAYRARIATGRWHDEDAGLAASLAPQVIGANDPPQDEADILRAQIEAASANAKTYETISDDATAAKAQSARARLNELSGQADKRREALKAPHLAAGKSIDGIYQPLVKAAKAAADAIARALSAHETRKANEAVRQLRESQRIAAEAARKAADAGKPPSVPIQPTPPIVAPEPVASIRGAYGRAAAVKVVRIATVTDYDAAYLSLKSNAELKALISKLAQKAVDAGLEIGGVTIEEQRKVT